MVKQAIIARISASSHINQRNFVLAIGILVLAVVVGFFAYQFKFLRPPFLEVRSPASDIATDALVFDVTGASDPDADLSLNGRPLYSGETGQFSDAVDLVKGVNRLEFAAKNRYGKTTTIVRYIVVR